MSFLLLGLGGAEYIEGISLFIKQKGKKPLHFATEFHEPHRSLTVRKSHFFSSQFKIICAYSCGFTIFNFKSCLVLASFQLNYGF